MVACDGRHAPVLAPPARSPTIFPAFVCLVIRVAPAVFPANPRPPPRDCTKLYRPQTPNFHNSYLCSIIPTHRFHKHHSPPPLPINIVQSPYVSDLSLTLRSDGSCPVSPCRRGGLQFASVPDERRHPRNVVRHRGRSA